MNSIIGYKLFTLRKDNSLGPLFINRKQIIEENIPYDAECHPTKGFAVRQGWHAGLLPSAPPHLPMKLKNGEERIVCKVLLEDFEYFMRPQSQGGMWILAQKMTVL